MALTPFSPSSYYRFSNANFPNTGISTGYKYENTPPHVGLTHYGSRSSENWQVYRQHTPSGRTIYFLRNYDYGAALQLGVTPEHRAVPQLLPRSGALGQQWSLELGADGKWVLTNELLGNASFLGVSGGGDSGRYTRYVPSMNPSPDGTEHWTVLINVSAGEIKEREALCDVDGLESPSPSQSTYPMIPLPASTSTSFPTTHPPISETYATFTTSLNACIGAFFLLLVTGLAMLWRRRRQNAYIYQPIVATGPVETPCTCANAAPKYEEEEQKVEGKAEDLC
ncbi:hypothetical protein K505DRAFT_323970 [Melanomma pulvis-pyrius CBS 109.77]|uniref:Ricin B lectin domain-containing protein n=1 Tax=Melanomma pulvis-pyrius CBS 109.77 TaxID=1314802 RepID=A0A6A6XHG1_9PLEO|nr:hypothetical protein K505DRAFT_323970 [Melanomma pulvis-pyrius CBS 109.77]